jgi:type I restriction enzyme R subunit
MGEVIWFHDVRHPLNRSRRVARFHTPAALRELLACDDQAAFAKLDGLPYHSLLRPYQIEAHEAVENAIRHHRRKMLVAMATGTGKTLTTVSQVHRLMKAGVAKRILFLVDRRALAAQAVRAFASYEAEPGLKFNKIYEVYSQRFQKDDIEDGGFDPNVLPNSYLDGLLVGQTRRVPGTTTWWTPLRTGRARRSWPAPLSPACRRRPSCLSTRSRWLSNGGTD